MLLTLTRPVKKILVYLESHPYINIKQFCRIAHINYYTACHILSDLIAVNTLKYSVVDKQIVYSAVAVKSSLPAYSGKE